MAKKLKHPTEAIPNDFCADGNDYEEDGALSLDGRNRTPVDSHSACRTDCGLMGKHASLTPVEGIDHLGLCFDVFDGMSVEKRLDGRPDYKSIRGRN